MGRKPLPPEQRKPRKSGPSGRAPAPAPQRATEQQRRLQALREQVGAELHRQRRASWPASEPAPVTELARVVDRSQSTLSAWGAGEAPARAVMRDETLSAIEAEVASWLAAQRGGATPCPGLRAGSPVLGAHLAAYGLLRMVSQVCPTARVSWSTETGDLLVQDAPAWRLALLERWAPTPILSPWNGGSGFWPKDSGPAATLAQVEASTDPRWASYQLAIQVARLVVEMSGLDGPPAGKRAAKTRLVQTLRQEATPDLRAWMDAVIVPVQDDEGHDLLVYPPVAGTGGNEGRLEYSAGHRARLLDLLSAPPSTALDALDAALVGGPHRQACPGAGPWWPDGVAPSAWSAVMALEGICTLATDARFRLAVDGPLPPWTVAGEDGPELWLPRWSRPMSLAEWRALVMAGPPRVGADHRPARTSLDWARACVSGAAPLQEGMGFTRYRYMDSRGGGLWAAV